LKILPEEVGDMGVILKAGVQTGRDPDFAMEIGSLIIPFQYYQLQLLIWSWLAENASFTGRITGTGTQFGQVDIIHSLILFVSTGPAMLAISSKMTLAVPRYARSRPQPSVPGTCEAALVIKRAFGP
jgi:hypothetical protein